MAGCGNAVERLAGFDVLEEGEDKSLEASLSSSDTRPLVLSSIFSADMNRAKTKQNGHR